MTARKRARRPRLPFTRVRQFCSTSSFHLSTADRQQKSKRVSDNGVKSGASQLDPIERSSEVLFGLIMVLTFTGSFRITGADHDDVHRMLLAALGCNLAWGII